MKGKARKIKDHAGGTGGGRQCPPLNELEQLCLEKFIYDKSLEGFNHVHDALESRTLQCTFSPYYTESTY